MIETMEYAEIISGYYCTSQYVSKYAIPVNAKYYSAAQYIYLFLFFYMLIFAVCCLAYHFSQGQCISVHIVHFHRVSK